MPKHTKTAEGFILRIEESIEELMSRGLTDRLLGIDSLEARVVSGHVDIRPTPQKSEFHLKWNA